MAMFHRNGAIFTCHTQFRLFLEPLEKILHLCKISTFSPIASMITSIITFLCTLIARFKHQATYFILLHERRWKWGSVSTTYGEHFKKLRDYLGTFPNMGGSPQSQNSFTLTQPLNHPGALTFPWNHQKKLTRGFRKGWGGSSIWEIFQNNMFF